MLPTIDMNIVNNQTGRYVRTHNTPIKQVEDELTKLYGGWRTVLCNSGQEAIVTLLDILQPDTVIVDDETYFETRDWLHYKNINTIQLQDAGHLPDLENALESAKGTILVIIDNPTTFARWYNVPKLAGIVHKYDGVLAVDNSIVSLYYSNPIKNGADVCIESYTKYVCGYGDVMAGGLCFADTMRWLEQKPVPLANPGQDNLSWVIAHRGNCVSPDKAYMVSRGLQTLACRMIMHTGGAAYIYDKLKEAGVDCLWPGCGGLITLPGKTEEFCRRLKQFKTVGTFGCTYSIADFFRSKERYPQGFCARLSVGLENPRDLWEDVKQALDLNEEE